MISIKIFCKKAFIIIVFVFIALNIIIIPTAIIHHEKNTLDYEIVLKNDVNPQYLNVDTSYIPDDYLPSALKIDADKAMKLLQLYFPKVLQKKVGKAEIVFLPDKRVIIVLVNQKGGERIFRFEVSQDSGEILSAVMFTY